MRSEERPYCATSPAASSEHAAHGKKQLGRLADYLVRQFATDHKTSRTIAITTTRSASGSTIHHQKCALPETNEALEARGPCATGARLRDGIRTVRGADATAIRLLCPEGLTRRESLEAAA
jgi:hypothetical protein